MRLYDWPFIGMRYHSFIHLILLIFALFPAGLLGQQHFYYVTKKYNLKGFAYPDNKDFVTIVYPGDRVEEIYREQNPTATAGKYYLYSRVRSTGGLEGFIPTNLLTTERKSYQGREKLTRHGFQQQVYWVQIDVLPVRERPQPQAQIYYNLRRGDPVRVVKFSEKGMICCGHIGKWALVQTSENISGWVFAAFLAQQGQAIDNPFIDKVADKKITGNPLAYTMLDYQNVYEYPSAFSAILKKLPFATQVKVKSSYSNLEVMEGIRSHWIEIGSGWIFAGYLSTKKGQVFHYLQSVATYFPVGRGTYRPGRKYGVYRHASHRFFHPEIHLNMVKNSYVYAIRAGKIILRRQQKGNFWLAIRHKSGLVSYYSGLDKVYFSEKQTIQKGQKIGWLRSGGDLQIQVRAGFAGKHFDPWLLLR